MGQSLSELKEEIKKAEKVMQKASEKIESMEIEQGAPPRITQLNHEPILVRPNEDNRKRMLRGAVVLAGLGMILVVFAVSQWLAGKRYDLMEHPPTP